MHLEAIVRWLDSDLVEIPNGLSQEELSILLDAHKAICLVRDPHENWIKETRVIDSWLDDFPTEVRAAVARYMLRNPRYIFRGIKKYCTPKVLGSRYQELVQFITQFEPLNEAWIEIAVAVHTMERAGIGSIQDEIIKNLVASLAKKTDSEAAYATATALRKACNL